MPNKNERDPLVSSGIVYYAKKGTSLIAQFPVPNGIIRPHKNL